MSPAFTPLSVERLPAFLVEAIAAARPAGRVVRVALDGPPCAQPELLAAALVEPLRAAGRDARVVDARTFWRDASLRLEFGREDVEGYLSWLDAAALRREVLDPLGGGGTGAYLPSLRDPQTNRMTRAQPVLLDPEAVVIVAGGLLLGLGLPFDLTVHLAMSPAARARRTPTDQAWTLPAFDRYDAEARPVDYSDVVVGLDDPRHPAVRTN